MGSFTCPGIDTQAQGTTALSLFRQTNGDCMYSQCLPPAGYSTLRGTEKSVRTLYILKIEQQHYIHYVQRKRQFVKPSKRLETRSPAPPYNEPHYSEVPDITNLHIWLRNFEVLQCSMLVTGQLNPPLVTALDSG